MLTALALSVVLAQDRGTAQTTPAPFSTPISADNVRLARTPLVDGKIGAEEWDTFTRDEKLQTYFQWEPGKLYLASHAPADQDVVWSFNLAGDAWKVGNWNYEVRVSFRDGRPMFKAKRLDTAAGSAWVDAPEIESSAKAAATADGTGYTVELAISDPGTWMFKRKGGKIGARVDSIPATSLTTDAVIGRALTPLTLGYDRAAGLLPNFTFSTDYGDSRAISGDAIKCRFSFKGDLGQEFKKIELRNEGDAKDWTTQLIQPFPEFDKKNRCLIDYSSPVSKDMGFGYRVLRAEVTGKDGVPTVIQSSWRVAPLVDFDFVKDEIPYSPMPRRMEFTYYIRSNTANRVDGVAVVEPPTGWRLLSGTDKSFLIYRGRTGVRRKFELEIPANATGSYPVIVKAFIGSKVIEHTEYIFVKPK